MPTARVWLPVLLGVIAAAGNYAVLDSATATTRLALIVQHVKAGTRLEAGHIQPVDVRSDPALLAAAVPFDQLFAAVGKPVRRRIWAGELMFRADIENGPTAFARPNPNRSTLTLPALRKAVYPPPAPDEYVTVSARPNATALAVKYGPFRFLGWVPHPTDPDAVLFAVEDTRPTTASPRCDSSGTPAARRWWCGSNSSAGRSSRSL